VISEEKEKNRKIIFVVFFFSMMMFSIEKKKIKEQSLLISFSIELRRRRHCHRHLSVLSRDSSRNHLDRFRHQFSEILR
jgi:protein-arginine kinase